MSPLIHELKNRKKFETIVCVTGQHREMLEQVLSVFGIHPEYNLEIMKKNQDLFDVTINILDKIRNVLNEVKPDIVLVHGDTSTTFVTSLACFYMQIPIGHVEAGLRTNNLKSPFPEEFNRQGVGLIADLHFSPTVSSKENLLKEGKNSESIFVTGNTAIDALKFTVKNDFSSQYLEWASDSKLILLTAHRRENIGKPLENIFNAVKRIIESNNDVKVIYPVHKNPKVREIANKIFGDNKNIKIIEPLEVVEFHNIIANSHIILTDSGGIQEEAPSLGKPVLVLRDTTERPEGVKAGTLKLVGTKTDEIYDITNKLLKDVEFYNGMSNASNPYGDGTASIKIVNILEKYLGGK